MADLITQNKVISNCRDCPCTSNVGTGRGRKWFCNLAQIPIYAKKTEQGIPQLPPDWCPLRTQNLKLSLHKDV